MQMKNKYGVFRNEFNAIEFRVKRWWFPFWVKYKMIHHDEDVNGNRICLKKEAGMAFGNYKDYEAWKSLGKPKSKKLTLTNL